MAGLEEVEEVEDCSREDGSVYVRSVAHDRLKSFGDILSKRLHRLTVAKGKYRGKLENVDNGRIVNNSLGCWSLSVRGSRNGYLGFYNNHNWRVLLWQLSEQGKSEEFECLDRHLPRIG